MRRDPEKVKIFYWKDPEQQLSVGRTGMSNSCLARATSIFLWNVEGPWTKAIHFSKILLSIILINTNNLGTEIKYIRKFLGSRDYWTICTIRLRWLDLLRSLKFVLIYTISLKDCEHLTICTVFPKLLLSWKHTSGQDVFVCCRITVSLHWN